MKVAFRDALATAATLAAVAIFAAPLQAQDRLSLADRVARLEQQQANPQDGAVGMVNRVQELQTQVQILQGQVEELQHALDEARQRSKEQYVDLDSRLGRLEGRAAPAAAAATSGTQPQPPDVNLGGPATTPAAPAAGNGKPTAADRAADGAPATAAADPAAESAGYNEAFSALKDGRYAESARRFQGFIDQYPNSELAANAWYWLGESYYATQNYPIALESFQTLLTRFPRSQKAPDALLKVGYSQYELKQFDAARGTLDEVVRRYPDTTVARLAQGRLRALATDAVH
ncbi:MAG: tol-pal system protein YbgF [Dokdonella sp.]|uniref:tol-pal system protein YbgF n=1 Tax=Dokdonella sp. TaxID=2291710 RepID=UPI0025C30789|nr:tol-pal system protein YbgF [Dokdonella sp.]MBX3700950.1 tol-pal system protein YbgF [Dokdonella sp.]MCW5578387.1 tol-pal system protein YbgF [Dokdonella sp.]